MSIGPEVFITTNTNALQTKGQIDSLSRSLTQLESRQLYKLSKALDNNKASAKELGYGILGAKKAITSLDKTISNMASTRVNSLMRQSTAMQLATKQEQAHTREILMQNEVMRIRRKIVDDTATSVVNLGKNTQWAGRQLVVGFTVPLTIAAGLATKAFSDLEKQMLRFNRVYGDLNTNNAELKQAAADVKALATEWTKYGQAVSDTIDIAASAAGAGFTGQNLLAQTKAATKLSVLGEIDKQKAFKATLAIQSTFKQSNNELAQSINYLNMLENQTIVTLDDMASALPKAATVVEGLGGSIKDLGVFMASMQEGGVNAAEAANALKSGLGSLLNPSKQAKEALSGVGLSMDKLWKDAQSNGEGVIYVVEQLGAALDKLDQVQKQRVIEELFGKHQFARMNALLSNINKGAQAKRAKEVGQTSELESALIAQKELDKLSGSSLTKFQSAIEKFKASIAPLGETILNVLTPIVNWFTKLIDKFNNAPETFKKIGLGIVAGIGIVAPLFLMLIGQVQNLFGNGMKLVNWITNWGKATKWASEDTLLMNESLALTNRNIAAQNELLAAGAGLWARFGAAMSAGARGVFGQPTKKMATGGEVPGTGNTDKVPALLTPGEFVVKKNVAQRNRGFLSALNTGAIRKFAGGGEVQRDSGYSKNIAPGEVALSSVARAELFEPISRQIEALADALISSLKLGNKAAKKLKDQMTMDVQEGPQAAHIVTERDASGKKVYTNSNLVAVSKLENNFMNIAQKQQNAQALTLATEKLIRAENASAELQMQRRTVLQKLISGEHVVDQAERKLAGELIVAARQLSGDIQLTGTAKDTRSAKGSAYAVAAYMGATPLTFTGEKATAQIAERERARIGAQASDMVVASNQPHVKTNSGMNILMLMTLFGSQISGITEKFGALGDALTTAITAFAALNMTGAGSNLLAGAKGAIGSAMGAKLTKLKGLGAVTSIGSKFKGLAAGGIGGLVGGIAGGMVGDAISNGMGGGRDVAGKAVSWGATGAGLGAMFGPWGVAIGGAVGALAGLTFQIVKNNKAMKEMEKNLSSGAAAWEKIAVELKDKFEIGKNKTLGESLQTAGMSQADQELYQTMREAMADSNGEWSKRIALLTEAQTKGRLAQGQIDTEIKGLILQLKGSGVKDEDISTIVAAFVDSLPEAVRQGIDVSTIADQNLPTVNSITKGINDQLTAMQQTVTVNFAQLSQMGSLLSSAASSSAQILLNEKEGSDAYKQAAKDAQTVEKTAKEVWANIKGNADTERTFLNSVGSVVRDMITSGNGRGLTEEKWNQMLSDAGENAVQLSAAAQALLQAGISIQNMTAAQVTAMAGAASINATAQNKADAADATVSSLDKSIADYKAAKSERDSRLRNESRAISLSKKDVSQQKIAATLEVTRINIEKASLADFTGNFNNAFNTTVDSFADAQYLIDSIGQKISKIQTNVIGPLQSKIDKLNHANELDNRRIEKLEKKRSAWEDAHQKRLDKINKQYEDQAKAIERVRQQNEFLAEQQKNTISLADSLSSGNLAGAAEAMVNSAQTQSEYSSSLADQQLADSRDAALAKENAKKNPYDSKIEAVQARIEKRTASIQALEDKIYRINKSVLEPMQRRAEKMSQMLASAKLQMEYEKANAGGIDQENFAREQALTQAQLQVEETKKLKDLEQQINAEFKVRAKQIADQHGIEMKNANDLGAALQSAHAKAADEAARAHDLVSQTRQDMADIAANAQDTVDFYNDKLDKDGLGQVLRDAIDYINGEGGNPTTKSGKPSGRGDYPGQVNGKYIWNGGEWQKFSKGGNVPGTGGRDNVAALLTPGEYVMRKSAVDRIGLANLERMNMGGDKLPATVDTGGASKFSKGGPVKFAAGGKVPFLGTFGDTVTEKLVDDPKIAPKTDKTKKAKANPKSGSLAGIKVKGRAAVAAAFERMIGWTEIPGKNPRIVAGKCANNVGFIWRRYIGTPKAAGEPTAQSAAFKLNRLGYMNRGADPTKAPRGVPVFWTGGAGHVAISDGHGNVINNLAGNSIVRTRANRTRSGYYGWASTFNSGGIVPGTGNVDSHLSMLTPGEVVIKKSVANAIGPERLNALNSTHFKTKKPNKYSMNRPESVIGYNNNQNITFEIYGATDPEYVADVVVNRLDRVQRSKVRYK